MKKFLLVFFVLSFALSAYSFTEYKNPVQNISGASQASPAYCTFLKFDLGRAQPYGQVKDANIIIWPTENTAYGNFRLGYYDNNRDWDEGVDIANLIKSSVWVSTDKNFYSGAIFTGTDAYFKANITELVQAFIDDTTWGADENADYFTLFIEDLNSQCSWNAAPYFSTTTDLVLGAPAFPVEKGILFDARTQNHKPILEIEYDWEFYAGAGDWIAIAEEPPVMDDWSRVYTKFQLQDLPLPSVTISVTKADLNLYSNNDSDDDDLGVRWLDSNQGWSNGSGTPDDIWAMSTRWFADFTNVWTATDVWDTVSLTSIVNTRAQAGDQNFSVRLEDPDANQAIVTADDIGMYKIGASIMGGPFQEWVNPFGLDLAQEPHLFVDVTEAALEQFVVAVSSPNGGEDYNKLDSTTVDINFFITDNYVNPSYDTSDYFYDINYSTTDIQGTGTSIVSERIATSDCSGVGGLYSCSYDWDISGVADDANYHILIEARRYIEPKDFFDKSDGNFEIHQRGGGGGNSVPDVNVYAPEGVYLNGNNSTYTIDFNAYDADTEDLNVRIAYSSTAGAFTNDIVADDNLASPVDANLSCTQVGSMFDCNYIWGYRGVVDGNYYIDINVYDDSLADANDSSSPDFMIDTLAPDTNWDGNVSWQTGDANIHLVCTDTNSGCSITKYRIDVGAWQTYDTNIFFSGDGNYQLDFNSTDVAGNIEDINTQYVLIDATSPDGNITTPLEGGSVSAKTVVFDLNDLTSGILDANISINGAPSSSFVFVTHCTQYDTNYHCSYTESGVVEGSNDLNIDYNDMVGNTASMGVNFTYTAPETPGGGGGTGGGGPLPEELYDEDYNYTITFKSPYYKGEFLVIRVDGFVNFPSKLTIKIVDENGSQLFEDSPILQRELLFRIDENAAYYESVVPPQIFEDKNIGIYFVRVETSNPNSLKEEELMILEKTGIDNQLIIMLLLILLISVLGNQVRKKAHRKKTKTGST